MIFARLDRADIDEIGPADRRDAVSRGNRQIGAERRHQYRRGPPGAIEMRPQRRAGYRGVHDERVGERGRGLDPAEMVRRLARLRVFGKFDRDQVVDQADEARPAARFQARDQSAPFEMVVRDQQIDGFAGAVAQHAEQPPLASDQQREAGAARNPAHPPLLLAQVERSAPGGADLADEILGRSNAAAAPACRPG